MDTINFGHAPVELVVATHNTGKIIELKEILADLPLCLRDLSEWPEIIEVEESGMTFEENAVIKARGYALQTGLATLVDDSGLEVAALNGAPGVFSARYAGPQATDAERIARLLAELDETRDALRRARFVCVIALAQPRLQRIDCFEGTCEGHIAREPRGRGGFGYDPVFVPAGYSETFGELPGEVKQRISHRARALQKAQSFLREMCERPA
ncbi:MAG: XTP/dITP diphosphatase [Pyrinomonadaceae bacterium]